MSATTARPVRIATRRSALAQWQANHVAALLNVPCELVLIETSGDARQSVPISEIGGKGVFVKEIQTAVLDGRADIAVHSAKDLPSETIDGLVLASVPERGDSRDALVGCALSDLPNGGLVATGSNRRRVQLQALRPDLRFAELRGNIATRLSKAADFDAIVMAAVALERLGEAPGLVDVLDAATMVPQVGQGALAIECAADDSETAALLRGIEDPASRRRVDAERAFLAELGGDCSLPAGAYAVLAAGTIELSAVLADESGARVLRHTESGDDPVAVGTAAAQLLRERLEREPNTRD